MSHAWLITGPPGSGRSNAARAFAAALQCERGGCGECNVCRTSLSGAHPDVTLVRTEQLSIGVDEVRDLVRRAAMSPTLRRLADHRGRGRRPGHRAGGRRPAEEHRGAGAAYGLDALRAERRRRGGHHPLPLPAAHPVHAERRARSPGCWRRGTASNRSWRRTRPGSPRATSGGPGCWPATNRPGNGVARCCRSRCSCRDWAPASAQRPSWWRRARRRRRRRPATSTRGSAARWRRRWASAPGGPSRGRPRRRSRNWRISRRRGPNGSSAMPSIGP